MSIAEDMVNGEMCSHCGVYFEQEHGYPVLCDNCYKEQEEEFIEEQYIIPKHIYEEV